MKHSFSLFSTFSVMLLVAACTATPAETVQEKKAVAPEFFSITPVRPIAELMPVALAAKPPVEQGKFRKSKLVDLKKLDSTMKFDIRYATKRNLLGAPLYNQPYAFMQRPAAKALVRVNRSLAEEGYGLLVFDAYRPWYITRLFWDAVPVTQRRFVADPAQGSEHNRGCAVDLTMYELKTGEEVIMPSMYDETTERAYPDYAGGTAAQRQLRDLLRRHMEAGGFTVDEQEWRHFDYKDWRLYAIQNERFEYIKPIRVR